MARLVILGSAAVISDAKHDNTHMVLEGEDSVILIDCASNPIGRLQQAGIHYEDLTDMVLTHFHPDHVFGVPILLNNMWLLGRQRPLRVYGLHHCLNRVEDMMVGFSWDEWPEVFPVAFHKILEREDQLILENRDFRITSWPTKHFIPTVGLRIENKRSGFVTGYTCDSAPMPNLIEIGRDVDLFICEAAGHNPLGHCSAREAGEIATQAGAKRLVLIHYQVLSREGPVDPTPLLDEARQTFDGPIELAEDFKTYEV